MSVLVEVFIFFCGFCSPKSRKKVQNIIKKATSRTKSAKMGPKKRSGGKEKGTRGAKIAQQSPKGDLGGRGES